MHFCSRIQHRVFNVLQVLTAEVVACNSCDLLLIVLIHSHATRDVPVTYLGPHTRHIANMIHSKACIYVHRPGNQHSPLAFYDPTRCKCKQVVLISLLIAFYRLILKFIFTAIWLWNAIPNIFKSQILTVLFHLIVLCFSWDVVREDRCKLVSKPMYVYIQ